MNKKLSLVSILIAAFLMACSSSGSGSDSKNQSDSSSTEGKNGNTVGGFTIEGKITNYTGASVKLVLLGKSAPKDLDSVAVGPKGTFSFKGSSPETEFFLIVYQGGDAPLALNNNSKVKIEIDAKKPGDYKITGDFECEQMSKLMSLNSTYMIMAQEFQNKHPMNAPRPEAEMKSLQAEFGQIMKKREGVIADFIHRPDTAMADFFALMFLLQRPDPALLEYVVTKQKPKYSTSHFFTELSEKTSPQGGGGVKIGSPAPELKLPNPDGKEVSLSSLKGKVVLIDFWASWCRPCMQELPNVKKAYDQYHNKGFEIYGVSLDNKKENWVGAIKDNNMNWVHVSDLKQWKSMVCPIYNVNSIPYTVLLDKQGNVIATNLRGEELIKKLGEVLGQ